MEKLLKVGIDVGSTTVKAVVMDADHKILWKDYRRHNAKQAELVHESLKEISEKYSDAKLSLFITGSGGRALAKYINAKFIQEVNAVILAVEKLYPDTGSVIELGGQDAKVILWKEDEYGQKSTTSFMNDKCAGGTGATIDKILGKIGVTQEYAAALEFSGKAPHNVAAKCGVFAETDVVGLLKSGVDKDELIASFLSAVVRQNLEVLVRGNILRDKVLLLGGPNTFIKMFKDIWRKYIPESWEIHGYEAADIPVEELVHVPDNAQYFAAIGAVLFGAESEEMTSVYSGEAVEEHNFTSLEKLEKYINRSRLEQLQEYGAVRDGLVQSEEEVEAYAAEQEVPKFEPKKFERGQKVFGYIGIDGGSTSTKLVIINESGELIYKDYRLSEGNPIDDTRKMFKSMKDWESSTGIDFTILGTSVTGYASDILHESFSLDCKVVETVAHMKSSMFYYGDVDVICDVGGQDIKVLFMRSGRVADFKLNTQCSAGNGYFLQGMAEQFGVPIEKYAEHAFKAKKAPVFNYGCAVFMEQDKVNFQQLGWTKDEIMAGLALVLPLNIWNYVVQESNIAKLGKRFVLQGGTQKNLAASKAQVDYIKERVPNAEVFVHKYADICGAIGAAIEAKDTMAGEVSRFIGIEQASNVSFTTTNDDSTRCRFCTNLCPRIFVDVKVTEEHTARFITGNACEKGAADNVEHMKQNEARRKELLSRYPNLVTDANADVFKEYDFDPMPENIKPSNEVQKLRAEKVVGIPKLLNLFAFAPFFSTYLRALGIGKVVYSDYTSAKLWEDGNKWGSIDPCFPAKVAPAHIYNLLKREEVTDICFPIVTYLQSHLDDTLGNNACVIQMGTPEVVHAAFSREKDHFAERGVGYWKPVVRMDRPLESKATLFEYFKDILEISEEENSYAADCGFKAQLEYIEKLKGKGGKVINWLVENNRIGIVVLGHPYHHDPGLNHGLFEEFQKEGFPILCIESLPTDGEFLDELFSEEELSSNSIRSVWMRNFNRNTNHKIWAARVIARHPNLAVLDLSSFKCGHDAPTYSYLDNIMDASDTPHFIFHDIDQNKPHASMKIRQQTIIYFLRHEEEKLGVLSKEK